MLAALDQAGGAQGDAERAGGAKAPRQLQLLVRQLGRSRLLAELVQGKRRL